MELDGPDGHAIVLLNDDLTNAVWAPDDRGVLYAVSPIYGTSGIYMIDARLGNRTRVIAPRNLADPAYPDGADWMALCAVSLTQDGRLVIRFVRATHVDSLDLSRDLPRLAQEADTL
jgi:hypothetical protein